MLFVTKGSVLEKRIAHYSLDLIKMLIKEENYRITGSAFRDAMVLGFDEDGILEIVLGLSSKDLYKSMTTNYDNKLWQDVYYVTLQEKKLYVKLQINDDAIIISFKERT